MLEKQIKLKHGISELGNLQVYPIIEILEEDKVISSTRGQAYTSKSIKNMEGFDQKSKDIVSVITPKEVKDAFLLENKIRTNNGIEKIITHDRIVEESGCIAVRRITRIFDNGKEIDKKYHRSWINPGDNPDNNDIISKALAMGLHTPKVIADYNEKNAKREISNK